VIFLGFMTLNKIKPYKTALKTELSKIGKIGYV